MTRLRAAVGWFGKAFDRVAPAVIIGYAFFLHLTADTAMDVADALFALVVGASMVAFRGYDRLRHEMRVIREWQRAMTGALVKASTRPKERTDT